MLRYGQQVLTYFWMALRECPYPIYLAPGPRCDVFGGLVHSWYFACLYLSKGAAGYVARRNERRDCGRCGVWLSDLARACRREQHACLRTTSI